MTAAALAVESVESREPLGRLLINAGVIGEEDLTRALTGQQRYGGRLGGTLVRLGVLSEDRLLPILGEQLGLPIASAESPPCDAGAMALAVERSGYPLDWWATQEAIVWIGPHNEIHCAARDPIRSSLQEFVDTAFSPEPVTWWLAPSRLIDGLLDQLRRKARAESQPIAGHLRELAEEAPVIELVNDLLSRAAEEKASDIHVEPGEENFTVRFRLDGVLHRRLTLPRERFDAVASRIKLIAGIDIAERRLPQDGRLSLRLGRADMDIRVSTLPGTRGESLVLRLLARQQDDLNLEHLGLEASDLERFRRWISEPHGVILVTGPTGSGKSTTLHAALGVLNDGAAKIITVEEPVEYNTPGIIQVQAHSEIGYTFARALRSILRQDPDVIMIGEIRDGETAGIAIKAALTGHLVFSTLHTNDALGAFPRLMDMGVEPFLVAGAVRGIAAQRLLRRLCPDCAVPDTIPPEIVRDTDGLADVSDSRPAFWRRPVGCPACHGIGYRGRLAIYELVTVTPAFHDALMRRATPRELAEVARGDGWMTLRETGLLRARRGITSIDEVMRVTGLEA